MARPRKPIAEKLVPATTNVPPDKYDALCRLAKAKRVSVALVIRQAITAFLNCETPTGPSSC